MQVESRDPYEQISSTPQPNKAKVAVLSPSGKQLAKEMFVEGTTSEETSAIQQSVPFLSRAVPPSTWKDGAPLPLPLPMHSAGGKGSCRKVADGLLWEAIGIIRA